MSLAVLKKKTNAIFSKNKCFVLNMTGRGGGIGKTVRGRHVVSKKPSNTSSKCDCSSCWGLDKPAPQMAYGIYINNKAKGSYRPSGYSCGKSEKCVTTNKPVWKLTTTYDASLLIEKKKIEAIHCNKFSTPLDPISGKPTSNAKPCLAGVKQTKKDHTNKNKKWCNNITKDLGGRRTASEQIVSRKAMSLDVCIPTPQEQILIFGINNGKISFIPGNKQRLQPTIYRGFPYKIVFQITGSNTSIKIYTNRSDNPINTCEVFYKHDSKSDSFQINKLTVSPTFCLNMDPILYFKTTNNEISIKLSKSYKGYGLKPSHPAINQCN